MRKHLFLFALIAVSVVSCKKDKIENNNDNGNGGSGPDPGPAVKMLKKQTQVTNGVTTVYNFIYNDSKQLTAIKTDDNTDVTNFTYDGGGNVTKVESTDTETHNIYQFEYENGIPVRGTYKSYNLTNGTDELTEDDVIHYMVENNKVTRINMDMNVQRQEVNFVLTYDNNANVTKIETDGSDIYKAVFTYGNKKPIFPKAFKFVVDPMGYSLLFYARNDMLSQRYDFPGTDNDIAATVQYTYDAKGYVLTSDDGTTTTTFSY